MAAGRQASNVGGTIHRPIVRTQQQLQQQQQQRRTEDEQHGPRVTQTRSRPAVVDDSEDEEEGVRDYREGADDEDAVLLPLTEVQLANIVTSAQRDLDLHWPVVAARYGLESSAQKGHWLYAMCRFHHLFQRQVLTILAIQPPKVQLLLTEHWHRLAACKRRLEQYVHQLTGGFHTADQVASGHSPSATESDAARELMYLLHGQLVDWLRKQNQPAPDPRRASSPGPHTDDVDVDGDRVRPSGGPFQVHRPPSPLDDDDDEFSLDEDAQLKAAIQLSLAEAKGQPQQTQSAT